MTTYTIYRVVTSPTLTDKRVVAEYLGDSSAFTAHIVADSLNIAAHYEDGVRGLVTYEVVREAL